MVDVVTYHSTNAKPNEQWAAFLVSSSGDQLPMKFTGKDEQTVKTRAVEWFKAEKVRQTALLGEAVNEAHDEDIKSTGGRGHHFAGKIWVINRQTDDKRRIEPNELAGFEAQGYVRGGPRSK